MVRSIKNISIKEVLERNKNTKKRHFNYSASEAVSEFRKLKKQYLSKYNVQKKEIASRTKLFLKSSNLGSITLTKKINSMLINSLNKKLYFLVLEERNVTKAYTGYGLRRGKPLPPTKRVYFLFLKDLILKNKSLIENYKLLKEYNNFLRKYSSEKQRAKAVLKSKVVLDFDKDIKDINKKLNKYKVKLRRLSFSDLEHNSLKQVSLLLGYDIKTKRGLDVATNKLKRIFMNLIHIKLN